MLLYYLIQVNSIKIKSSTILKTQNKLKFGRDALILPFKRGVRLGYGIDKETAEIRASPFVLQEFNVSKNDISNSGVI